MLTLDSFQLAVLAILCWIKADLCEYRTPKVAKAFLWIGYCYSAAAFIAVILEKLYGLG